MPTMRDSYFRLVVRCASWAARGLYSGVEIIYSTVFSFIFAIIFDLMRRYFGVELMFSSPVVQNIAIFVASAMLVMILRMIISPFVLWMQDVRSLTQTLRSSAATVERQNLQIDKAGYEDPRLYIRVDQIVCGFSDDAAKEFGAVIVISIINAGRMPSIAEKFRVKIINQSTVINGELTHHSEKLNMSVDPNLKSDVSSIVFNPCDIITEKSANPISPGGLVRGHLLVLFHGFKPENRFRPIFEISCHDVHDRIIKIETKMGGNATAMHYPQTSTVTNFR